MDLSIVIVSYRTPEHLRRCLTSLAALESPLSREVLVVDNDSGDASPEVARSFAGVTVIETGRNLGFAGGVNRGLTAARGRMILVLNPDVEVREGSLDALVAFMDEHPGTGLAGPKLLNSDGSIQHSCRRFYTLSTVVLRRTPLGRLFPNAPVLRRHLMLDYDHAEARDVDWITGAAMIVRREALDDVGPMDERYFLYFEDVDWCTRMQARGWLVHYVPDSVMVHHWQHASGAGLGRAARTHLRSGLRFYERWGSLLYVLHQYRAQWTRALLVVLDLAAILASFLAAFGIRRELAVVLSKPVWPLVTYRGFLATTMLVFLGVYAAHGLYREVKRGDWVDVGFRVARAATLAALIVMGSTFLLNLQGYSRLMVVGSWPIAAALTFLARVALARVAERARRGRLTMRRVALVGPDAVLDWLERVLLENPDFGWEPVRIRTAQRPGSPPSEEGLLRRLAAERVHEVAVTPAGLGVEPDRMGEALLPIRREGFEIKVVTAFLAGLPARARLEAVGPLTWLDLSRPSLGPARASKRILDLGLAVVLGVAGLLPFLAVVLGRLVTGRRIREPEAVLLGQWNEPFRVRRLAGGGWVRSMPLLLAVLRGRMSLVGPRPLAPGTDVPGGASWSRVRELHRPGLTGPWSLAPAATPDEEMQQELRYLENWTLEADLKLLTRVALRRSGNPPGPAAPDPRTRTDVSPAHPDTPRPGPGGLMESRSS